MTLYEKIKSELTTYRKARDSVKVTIISTILGEMNSKAVINTKTSEKEVSDEIAIAVIKKSIKGLEETLSLIKPDVDKTPYENEKKFLETYLPPYMTNKEMETETEIFMHSNPSAVFGNVMSHFKEKFPGRYDGKVLSGIVKAVMIK